MWRVVTFCVVLLLTPQTHAEEKCGGTFLADIVFLLDSSGSLGNENYPKVLDFAANIARSFDIGEADVLVGAVVFGSKVKKLFDLNTYSDPQSISQAILAAPFLQDRTRTDRGLKLIREEKMFSEVKGGRTKAQDIVILITDGKSNVPSFTQTEAAALRARGTRIISIGVRHADDKELLGISGKSADVFIGDFSSLNNVFSKVTKRACDISPPKPVERKCKDLLQVDIIFLLDSSGSLGYKNYVNELQFAVDITRNFDIGRQAVQFAAVIFSSSVELLFDLDSFYDQAKISQAIRGAKFLKTRTRTDMGLEMIKKEKLFSAKRGGRDLDKIVILVTDGRANKPEETLEAAKVLRDEGVTIISVGVANAKENELYGISGNPANVFMGSYKQFNEISKKVTQRVCTAPSAKPPPPPTSTTTTTTTTPKSKPPPPPTSTTTTTTTTPKSTLPPITSQPADPCAGSPKVDVIYLLDASGSLGIPKFTKEKTLAVSVIENLPLGPNGIQVGVVVYSSQPEFLFGLNNYTDIKDFSKAIDKANYSAGSTRTNLGFDLIRKEKLFSTARGGRPDANDVIILITDGVSNEPKLTKDSAALLKAEGVSIVAIGVGIDIKSRTELLDNYGAENVFESSWKDVVAVRDRVARKTCSLG